MNISEAVTVEIAKLRLGAGDTLVVKVDAIISNETASKIKGEIGKGHFFKSFRYHEDDTANEVWRQDRDERLPQ